MFRILLSITIGWALGLERKKNDKSGGSRTMAIVSLSACLMAILSLEILSLDVRFDFVRIMSYGVASIGFLGSGLIMKSHGKIEGITTASTLWCLVPLNFMIGLGYFFYGITSAVFLYFLLESKYWFIKKRKRRNKRTFKIGDRK
jgi:putative Mg2+ transporter-C (MgtC) family protein